MFIDPEFEQYVEMLRTQQPKKLAELLERVIPVVEKYLRQQFRQQFRDSRQLEYNNVLGKLNSLHLGS
tara:strand:- start:419 stop:622 length:204 start_codon:yes stop_codon:yes gene_type:complete